MPVSDLPFGTTLVAMSIIDPRLSGVYCFDGKNELPVNGIIWDRDPEKDAGWRIWFIRDKNTPPVEVDHDDWQPDRYDTSKPGIVRINITADVNGIDYFCSRDVTVFGNTPNLG